MSLATLALRPRLAAMASGGVGLAVGGAGGGAGAGGTSRTVSLGQVISARSIASDALTWVGGWGLPAGAGGVGRRLGLPRRSSHLSRSSLASARRPSIDGVVL